MHLVYIDASGDQGKYYVYTALAIHETAWRPVLNRIKQFRKDLKTQWGIPIGYELHAWKFLQGKGDLGPKVAGKANRYKVLKQTLEFTAGIKRFGIFNSANTNEQYAFERLINRIERTMKAKDSRALLICDEGEEQVFIRRVRKMNAFNYIASNQGAWAGGAKAKNITLDRIIEDPVFKDSAQSHFIQLADFCAYALLRMDRPLESREAFGGSKMFHAIGPACFKGANRKDPYGVIR